MSHFEATCPACARTAAAHEMTCARCGGPLSFRYDEAQAAWDDTQTGMWRYWRLLPAEPPGAAFTLDAGGTPLLPSRTPHSFRLYYKDEMRCPTGSHKDRALNVALAHARRLGARASLVVSAGSTGLSNAAAAARAGLKGISLFTAGTDAARLYPMAALGAHLLPVSAHIDDIIRRSLTLRDQIEGLYLSTTSRLSNPYQTEGAKTIAYEIVEALGDAPNWMIVPVGGGGTIAGLWRGFEDVRRLGRTTRSPRLVGVVPAAYNGLEQAFSHPQGAFPLLYEGEPTLLAKLAHLHPPDGEEALQAVRDSGGVFISVTDAEAVAGVMHLGRAEGFYSEPSTSVCWPAAERLHKQGMITAGEVVVALLCGSGFRETHALLAAQPLTGQAIYLAELQSTLTALLH